MIQQIHQNGKSSGRPTFWWGPLSSGIVPLASVVDEMEQLHNCEIWIFCDAEQEEFDILVDGFVTVLTSLNFGFSAQ